MGGLGVGIGVALKKKKLAAAAAPVSGDRVIVGGDKRVTQDADQRVHRSP